MGRDQHPVLGLFPSPFSLRDKTRQQAFCLAWFCFNGPRVKLSLTMKPCLNLLVFPTRTPSCTTHLGPPSHLGELKNARGFFFFFFHLWEGTGKTLEASVWPSPIIDPI